MENSMIYNEINLGFAKLVVYTDNKGIVKAHMKNSDCDYSFKVPKQEIYTKKVAVCSDHKRSKLLQNLV